MLENSASFALLSLPFVLPLCFIVAWSDMRAMRIPNWTVLALAAVFVVIGLFTLPWSIYGWGFIHLLVVLVVGIVMNAAGLVGAGDAKFAAAAAPFISLGDFRFFILLFAANIAAALITHRMTLRTKLAKLAPGWDSWERTWEFPMGFSLGGTLGLYLILSAIYGS